MVKFFENLLCLLACICITSICLGGIVVPTKVYAEQTANAIQQQKMLKGTVTDELGHVIGASVSIVGKTTGTVSDENGDFTLSNLVAGDVIRISYLGYTSQDVVYSGQASVNVVLKEDMKTLDEVVVTALGIKRDARALGYAVSSIKGDAITAAGLTANPLASLYGKAAGVGIQSTAAGPMGGMQIKIRGAASLNPSSNVRPLFVVDGVPIYDIESSMASRGYDPLNSFDYGSGINDINPEDIESMEILKGAKASVLYGSAGANGVVLITTKSGKSAQGIGIQVNYGHEWKKTLSLIDFQNEYGTGQNEYTIAYTDETRTQRKNVSDRFNFGPKFDGTPMQFFDGTVRPYQAYPDNFLDLFQDGSADYTTVSLQGGGQKGNARLAYTNYNYSGIMENQNHRKNTLSFNGLLRPSDVVRFEFTENLYVTKTKNRRQNMQQSVVWGTFNRDYDLSGLRDVYKDENGWMHTKEKLEELGWPRAFTSSEGGLFDMLWNNYENENLDEKIHSITSAKTTVKFLPYLSLRVQGGIDYTTTDYTKKDKVLRKNATSSKWEGGKFKYDVEEAMIQNYEGFLSFDKDFMNDELHIDAFAGGAYKRFDYTKTNVGTMGNFIYPDFWTINNMDGWPSSFDGRIANYLTEAEATYSVLGQAFASYKDKYIFEFQARNDWSSTLPKVNRSYFYPGASFTWNFTDDLKLPLVNYGKVWLSWANVGRPAPRYFALNSYNVTSIPTYPETNDITSVIDDNQKTILFMGDIKPERKREIETGVDVKFFEGDRLGINFSYYDNTVYDQIMAVNLSPTTGKDLVRINAGEVKNQGIELLLKGLPIAYKNFKWDVSLSLAHQWSEVVKLYPGIDHYDDIKSDIYNRAKVGEPVGSLYLRDYAKDPDGNRIVTAAGLYSLSTESKDEICAGNINPDVYGGLNSSFISHGNWGEARLSFGIDYKFGGNILSYSNVYLKGNGLTVNSLPYRDAAHGGIEWTETLSDGSTRTRHDGLILPGVKNVGTPENPQYVKNDIVISAYDYYSSFLHSMLITKYI